MSIVKILQIHINSCQESIDKYAIVWYDRYIVNKWPDDEHYSYGHTINAHSGGLWPGREIEMNFNYDAEPIEAILEIAENFNHDQLHAVGLLAFSAMIAQSSLKMEFSFSHQCGSVGAELTLNARFRRYDVSFGEIYEPSVEENQAEIVWTTTSGHTITFQVFRREIVITLGDDDSETFYPKIIHILSNISSGEWKYNIWRKTY